MGGVAVLLSLVGLSEPATAATVRQTFLLAERPGEQGITVTAIGPIREVEYRRHLEFNDGRPVVSMVPLSAPSSKAP